MTAPEASSGQQAQQPAPEPVAEQPAPAPERAQQPTTVETTPAPEASAEDQPVAPEQEQSPAPVAPAPEAAPEAQTIASGNAGHVAETSPVSGVAVLGAGLAAAAGIGGLAHRARHRKNA